MCYRQHVQHLTCFYPKLKPFTHSLSVLQSNKCLDQINSCAIIFNKPILTNWLLKINCMCLLIVLSYLFISFHHSATPLWKLYLCTNLIWPTQHDYKIYKQLLCFGVFSVSNCFTLLFFLLSTITYAET